MNELTPAEHRERAEEALAQSKLTNIHTDRATLYAVQAIAHALLGAKPDVVNNFKMPVGYGPGTSNPRGPGEAPF